jgi:hypothetical protein
MVTIKNHLNQPLTIGEKSIAAGSTLKVDAVDKDVERLVNAGHVSVIEEVSTKTPEDPNKGKENAK